MTVLINDSYYKVRGLDCDIVIGAGYPDGKEGLVGAQLEAPLGTAGT